MLAPGDAYVLYRKYDMFDDEFPEAIFVISVDTGKMHDGLNFGGRPASVLLLTSDVRIVKKDFTWIGRYYKKVNDQHAAS